MELETPRSTWRPARGRGLHAPRTGGHAGRTTSPSRETEVEEEDADRCAQAGPDQPRQQRSEVHRPGWEDRVRAERRARHSSRSPTRASASRPRTGSGSSSRSSRVDGASRGGHGPGPYALAPDRGAARRADAAGERGRSRQHLRLLAPAHGAMRRQDSDRTSTVGEGRRDRGRPTVARPADRLPLASPHVTTAGTVTPGSTVRRLGRARAARHPAAGDGRLGGARPSRPIPRPGHPGDRRLDGRERPRGGARAAAYLVKPVAGGPDRRAVRIGAPSRRRRRARDACILVVEDNPKNLKLVRDVLQYSGYGVVEARPVRTASGWRAR